MDYRTLNVCMWLFFCVPMHTGVGNTDSEWSQHFLLAKTQVFLALLTGFKPQVVESLSLMLHQLSHPITPIYRNVILHAYTDIVQWCMFQKNMKSLVELVDHLFRDFPSFKTPLGVILGWSFGRGFTGMWLVLTNGVLLQFCHIQNIGTITNKEVLKMCFSFDVWIKLLSVS